MTDHRCKFSTSDRHRKLNQLPWQNMSAHLTNETSYWRKKLLMYLNWTIYNVYDLNIDLHIWFFPDLVTGSGQGSGSVNPVSTARGLSATQRDACMCSLTTQKPKRLPTGWIGSKFHTEHVIDAAVFCANNPLLFICRLSHLPSPWASCQIRKIAGCACAGNAGNVFPTYRLQRKPQVSDPGMHHGTCVTHVPWCMSESLIRGGGENVPGIPGACATRNFAYLARGPSPINLFNCSKSAGHTAL